MDQNDKQAIEGLFSKLRSVEQQAAARDPQAEAFIRDAITRQPGAPYYMAQTIVVQEGALQEAQSRIAALETELAAARNSRSASPFSTHGQSGSGSSPWQRSASGDTRGAQPRAGGGFLAGAAQTAMGVAGGLMLGNALGGLFGGGAAEAAEPPADAGDDIAEDAGWDDAEM
ncbi:DUF2076 domain-containing protein [Cereibacter changlensis JA139]|uniref:DUF2076 domain-containing protein n=2 Tax=Cereibacter changlensis TaxID=402884 RepID=A0A2T4JHZ6_9RHOB|nr:DUF2076 family protein [Cereibacter changlensis]PTE17397.1 DUF2076 domain-containing protein [Cereibacter changlensis JA139]